MKRFYVLPLALAAAGFLVTDAQAQQYRMTSFRDPWYENTVLTGINDKGDIVGNVIDFQTGGTMFGFLYENSTGAFTKIEAPGAARTSVSGVNNAGQVVGSYSNYDTFREFDSYGFVYENGSFHDVNVPNPRNAGTFPTDINNSGTVAGWYDWGVEDFFGFKYDGNGYNDIYAGWETFATGITGKGEVVGFYQPEIDHNYGFIYDGTVIKDFNYPGAFDTYLYGASESGMILGSYTLPIYDAMYPDSVDSIIGGGNFLWNGTEFVQIEFPASDVNSDGWIVGSYLKYGDPWQFATYASFLAVPAGDGNGGTSHGSAAVPEPATMVLLGGTVAGLFAVRRRSAG